MLIDQYKALEATFNKQSEDNKLLKRAVGIQDSRYRETSQQNNCIIQQNAVLVTENEQMRSTLASAAEYMARLESENNRMRLYIEQESFHPSSYYHGDRYNPDQPPPDIY